MRESRPKLSVPEMMGILSKEGLSFAPFKFEFEFLPEETRGSARARSSECGDRRFVVECRAEWSRQALEEIAAKPSAPAKHLPLVIFPYLSEDQLDELRQRRISGLDLCGNGLLFDPPHLLVLRTGAKKTFKLTSAASSAYQSRNVASLVARVFLTQPVFPTTKAVLAACRACAMPVEGRAPPLVLPTVSKALTQLRRDHVVNRKSGERELRLQDPDRLLTNLARYFRAIEPPASGRYLGKTSLPVDAIWARLKDLRPQVRAVVTGRASSRHSTGLAGPERLQLHVDDVQRVVQALEAKPNPAFPNLELIETQEEVAYFDAREHAGVVWSSPVQTFLELSEGTAREVDVAQELRAHILSETQSLLK